MLGYPCLSGKGDPCSWGKGGLPLGQGYPCSWGKGMGVVYTDLDHVQKGKSRSEKNLTVNITVN